MKVLVTGSAGFIGNQVTGCLERNGHKVHGIDLIDCYPYEQCDARTFFRENDQHYDLVIHCAALVGGRVKIENSPVAYAQNLELDAGLFQWAERVRPGRIVYISSVAAYPVELQEHLPPDWLLSRYELQDALNAFAGDPEFRGKVTVLPPRRPELREEDIDLDRPRMPDKVYGWAKLTGEMLARESSVPVSVVRPFTVYGEGQDPVFPFANIMQQIRERKDPVTAWGSGNQVRDFVHVEDVVNAIITMAEQEIDGPVNLCTGRAVSLNELARKMAVSASWLFGTHHYDPRIETLPDKPEGLPYRAGNPAKLHEFYIPEISLEDGIEKGLRA